MGLNITTLSKHEQSDLLKVMLLLLFMSLTGEYDSFSHVPEYCYAASN